MENNESYEQESLFDNMNGVEKAEPKQYLTAETKAVDAPLVKADAVTDADYIASLMDKGLYVYPYEYAKTAEDERKPRYIHGLMEHGHSDATNDKTLINTLFEPDKAGNINNYGVAINLEKSGMFCLDFDNHGESIAGNTLLAELLNRYPKMAKTVKEFTPHGIHFYYHNDLKEDESNTKDIENLKGIEILTGHVNVYPSKDYKQAGETTLADNEPLPLPDDLHEYLNKLLTGKVKAPVNTKATDVDASTDDFQTYRDQYKAKADEELDANFAGGRHSALIRYSGKLNYAGYDTNERADIINDYVMAHDGGDDPLDNKELSQIASYPDKKKNSRTIYDYFKEKQLIKKAMHSLQLTQNNNPDILQARKLAFNWIETANAKKKENENKVKTVPTNVAAEIMLNAFNIIKFKDDEGQRIALYVNDSTRSQYGLYTQNYTYISSVINEIFPNYNLRKVNETIKKLEWKTHGNKDSKPVGYQDKDRIPVGNGIYNTNTHELEEYTPDYVFTTKITTNYNPKYLDEKNAPVINGWDLQTWLYDLCKDETGETDGEIYTLLWQVLADASNGNYTHQMAIILYSAHGGSGKGTFQRLIENLVGRPNVATARLDQLSERFTLSRLDGKTICVGDDNKGGYYGDIQNIKSIIKGDGVTIEPKGMTGYDANLKLLVIQSMNELPTFKDKGGVRRRFRVVPFKQHYSMDEGATEPENRAIKEDYLARQDVLEYALCHALTYYYDFEEYINPQASKLLMSEIELDSDSVRAFLTEEFISWDLPIISTDALYYAYKQYCKINGYVATSRHNFARRSKITLKSRDVTTQYVAKRTRISKKNFETIKRVVLEHQNYLYGTDGMNQIGKITQCFERLI